MQRDAVYLADILSAAADLREFTRAASFEEFCSNQGVAECDAPRAYFFNLLCSVVPNPKWIPSSKPSSESNAICVEGCEDFAALSS